MPQHIGFQGNINTYLDNDIIDAWSLVRNAKCPNPETITCTTKFTSDNELLRQVKSMRSQALLMQTLGGDDGLKEIMQKHELAGCYTCQGQSVATPLPIQYYMHNYLRDVEYFVANYLNLDGALGIIDGQYSIKSNGRFTVKGNAFVLRALRQYQISPVTLTGFEFRYNEVDPLINKTADIKELNGKLIECKSWGLNAVAFNAFINPDGPLTNNSRGQFIGYLGQGGISSMSNLEYWFDKHADGLNSLSLPAAENAVKLQFQKMLCANFYYGTPPGANIPFVLTTAGQAVFDAIWSNVALRGNLFTETFGQSASWLEDNKDNQQQKFANRLANITDSFFNFIKVK